MGIKLNLKWVSDVIGEEWKTWNKGDIVKINAQTGTGKTHFIINVLLKKMNSWEKLVYICNRIELKRQIKLDLLKKYDEFGLIEVDEDTKNTISVEVDEDIIVIDMNKLDKLTEIKNITICSYHELAERELDNIYYNTSYSLHGFKYIVCDECHFFLTDAGFNNKTSYTFFNLVREEYPDSIRIFISATMDEVDKAITKGVADINEENVFSEYKVWDQYNTGLDYSYVNPKYFKYDKDIIQTIKNDKSEEKWLIFVTSKNKGNFIKEELKNKCITAEFIHAKSNNKEKKNISVNNKFQCKVLISTKCLDNGINIKDDELKNIVIMSYDKTTFIQELGRLRIDIENAKNVNCYIPMFDKDVFEKHMKKYNKAEETIKIFNTDKVKFKRLYNNNERSLPTDIFYLNKDDERVVNLSGMARLYKDIAFTKLIIEKFKYDEFTFVKEQLEWLGLQDTFNKDNLIINVADDDEKIKLRDYLDCIEGKKLFADEQQELSDMIIKQLITVSKNTDYRTKKVKPSSLEKLLRDDLKLYYVVSRPKPETKGEMRNKRYIIITKMK